MSIITVNQLSKTYGSGKNLVQAIDNISFDVPEKSIFGFLGPNGAGKSTTIGILMQFLYQDSGEVYIFGEDVKKNIPKIKSQIGLIPDADLPKIPGIKLLKHTGRYYGLQGKKLREKIIEVVKITESKSYISRSTAKLSKGQKTRIKIANALLTDPRLIIADEPTSGLDPVARRQLLQLITDLAQNQGKTIFFSSHVIGEVEKIANNLLVLTKGKVVANGTIQDIMKLLPSSNKFIVSVDGINKEELEQYSGILQINTLMPGRFEIETKNELDRTPLFIKELISNEKAIVHSFARDIVDLEDVFFQVINND